MNGDVHATLVTWGNFYLITGTAAAALTGLQFIVQTLLASDLRPAVGDDPEGGIGAFATPTVVHFSLALVISAILCAPWNDYTVLRFMLGGLGIGALLYVFIITRRARKQQSYTATAYDWFWHIILPVIAYGSMLLSALFLADGTHWSLDVIAAATILLVCIGIHNAWDTVTYLTIFALRSEGQVSEAPATRKLPGTRRKHRK